MDGATGAEYQTGELNCGSQETNCTFFYTGPAIKGAETLVFKNANGSIVAAYVSGFEQGAYEVIIVQPWNTGLYLFQQLKRQHQDFALMSQDTIESNLHAFLNNYTSPDGAADYYEEIASYYAYELAASQPTLETFLNRFAERLRNGEEATTSEFGQIVLAVNTLRKIQMAFMDLFSGKQSLIKPAYAVEASGSCPAGVTTFFNFLDAIANGVQNAFPIGGTVATASLSLVNSACTAKEPSLTDVVSKLNKIQTAIDNLHDDLKSFKKLYSNETLAKQLDQFILVSKNAAHQKEIYDSLTKGGATSLIQYVKSTGDGTLKSAVKNSKALSTILGAIRPTESVNATDRLLNNIDNLTTLSTFTSMMDSIKVICGGVNEGDIVNTRLQCNLAINSAMGRLLAAQKVSLKIAQDVYELLDESSSSETTAKDDYYWTATKATDTTPSSATKATQDLKAKFDKQLTDAMNMIKVYIVNSNPAETGFYNVYDGLSPTLLAKMKEVACWDNKTNAAAIGGWIINKGTEYLQTNCRVGDLKGPSVLARYFRKINGTSVGNDDVANVMGVLVERQYVSGPSLWYAGNRYTDVIPSYFDTMKVNLRGISNPASLAAHPNHFAINNKQSFYAPNVVTPSQSNSISGWILRLLDPQAAGYESGVSSWDIYWNNPLGESVVNHWMRYTDDKNYSYVFRLATVERNKSKMYCVTGDCTIERTPNTTLDYKISFVEGPQRLGFWNGAWRINYKPLYPKIQ